jgi:hypothetical protein
MMNNTPVYSCARRIAYAWRSARGYEIKSRAPGGGIQKHSISPAFNQKDSTREICAMQVVEDKVEKLGMGPTRKSY